MASVSTVSEVRKSCFAEMYKEMRRLARKFKSLKLKTKSVPTHLKKVRSLYVRYADDWVIFTNMDRDSVEGLKSKIGSFLKSELGLTLSKEKTILTDLAKGYARFLGFRFKKVN